MAINPLCPNGFFLLACCNKLGMVTGYNFNIKCLSLKIVFVIANSVDTDEMPRYVAFHLDVRCLPKNALGVTSIERVKTHLLQNQMANDLGPCYVGLEKGALPGLIKWSSYVDL